MDEFLTLEKIDSIAGLIRKRLDITPEVGLILGSGLGDLANLVEDAQIIPYSEIPSWPVSTVVGHSGRLVVGKLAGQNVLFMQGRAHYYEGYPMSQIGLPVRVMQRLGVKTLIITNAAGAINPAYTPGDVMMLVDHIALIAMTGLNPLRGPNIDEFGVRFPDMSQVYDRELADTVRNIAKENQINLHEGVYVCLSGPSFETPADLRFLKVAGADAVGMSTVPEAIVAKHGGLKVVGFSGISNKANLDGSTITTHEEVLEAGEKIVPKLKTLILGLLERL